MNWLKANGWPEAVRRDTLKGTKDEGDLIICRRPLITAQVKAGRGPNGQTEKSGPKQIADWLEQTETQSVRAGADLTALICQRYRRPVAQWDAWMRANDWALLLTGDSILPTDAPWPLRASLADWAVMAADWAELN